MAAQGRATSLEKVAELRVNTLEAEIDEITKHVGTLVGENRKLQGTLSEANFGIQSVSLQYVQEVQSAKTPWFLHIKFVSIDVSGSINF